ncbi:MAG: I78 family peptidase inhibitor [Rhodospirillaceae bacterium]|nr:I78 family peptidase inhibitor [Rhodospirillaceae bacterium]
MTDRHASGIDPHDTPMRDIVIALLAVALAVLLAGCGANGQLLPPIQPKPNVNPLPEARIRQPVLPEYLVGCRGHVLVPALGMTFVARGAPPPAMGQYVREERLVPPYRVVRPGDRLTQEQVADRVNIELDGLDRIIGLSCG